MNEDHIMDYLIERYNKAKNKPAKDRLLMMINQCRDSAALEKIAVSLDKIYNSM